MTVTCKKITYKLLVRLGKEYGYIDFKGYTMDGLNGCWAEYCDNDFEFKDDKELHDTIQDFIIDCSIQDAWAEEQQMDSMYASM